MTTKKITITNDNEEDNFGAGFAIGLFLGAIIVGLFLWSIGALSDGVMSDLNVDKDALAKQHVLKYYPEYENCTFNYRPATTDIDCGLFIDGIEIYCPNKDNRDGLVVSGTDNLVLTLCLEGTTIEEIFFDKLRESGLEFGDDK